MKLRLFLPAHWLILERPGRPPVSQLPSQKQLKKGQGLFTVEIDSSAEKIEEFCNSLTYWRMAVSWGGFESLIIPSCTFVKPGLYSTLSSRLIRFSVGLESADVLIRDIDNNMHLL